MATTTTTTIASTTASTTFRPSPNPIAFTSYQLRPLRMSGEVVFAIVKSTLFLFAANIIKTLGSEMVLHPPWVH